MKAKKTISLSAVLALVLRCGSATMENAPVDLDRIDATTAAFGASDTSVESVFNSMRDGSFTYLSDLWITSADGTRIEANIMVPNGFSGQKYPTIIFVNSWSANKAQYLVPAATLAKKGYVVLTYSTRGFGKSEGLINVAGPRDMEDLRAIINWLKGVPQVDAGKMGMSGISYGAGISLLGLAQMPEIKTAAAMSGWGNLEKSLYAGEAAQQVWGSLLIASGYFTGRMDPAILQNYQNLVNRTNMPQTLAWAAVRSVSNYVGAINLANKPVYISSNFSDNLFNPNQMLEFYETITSPKRLDFNQGIHASAELPGLNGLPNFTWSKAYAWFDYWLKGTQNGIMNEPKFTMESKFNGNRSSFSQWPSAQITKRTLYLKPRGLLNDGELSTSTNFAWTNNEIFSGADTSASSGIPLVSQILESHVDVPVMNWLNSVNRLNGIVFKSGTYFNGLKIRGRVLLKANVALSTTKGQLVAYLYDTDVLNNGKLITFGCQSIHSAVPFVAQNVTVKLDASAYDLPWGHTLSLVVDTEDPQFSKPTHWPGAVKLNYSAITQQTLEVDTML